MPTAEYRRDEDGRRPDRRFAELDRVSLREDVQVDGGSLPRGALGTVVALWGDGAAYEVEFTSPRPALVTLRGSALATP